MYCKKCGKQNKDGSRYCICCGNPLDGVESGTSGAKRKNTLILLISICAFVIILLLLGIFFVLSRETETEPEWKVQGIVESTKEEKNATVPNMATAAAESTMPIAETSAPLKASDRLPGYWVMYYPVANGTKVSELNLNEDGTVFMAYSYVSLEYTAAYEGTWSIISQEDGETWSATLEIRASGSPVVWGAETDKQFHSVVEICGSEDMLKITHVSGDALPLVYGEWYTRNLDYFEWSGKQELPSYSPDFVLDISVEEQVLDIREKYYEIRGDLDAGRLQTTRIRSGVCAYQDSSGNTRMIIVDKGTDGIGDDSNSYRREYYYTSNGELFFALYSGDDSHRFYFCEDRLIRWRYRPVGASVDEAINMDLEYLSDAYLTWERIALEESGELN